MKEKAAARNAQRDKVKNKDRGPNDENIDVKS